MTSKASPISVGYSGGGTWLATRLAVDAPSRTTGEKAAGAAARAGSVFFIISFSIERR